MAAAKEQKHFVLVHGVCHGAWCWYKIIPCLESAGHLVTALDLSASGINMKSVEDLHAFADYSKPLLDVLVSLPPHERVVLVGHSFGGLSLALAMEKFPEKISVAVFLTAFMPDTIHPPSYVLEVQDLELAKTLIRPGSLFVQDLSEVNKFTDSRYGSVTRVFIVCNEDKAIKEEFQRWMIENSGTKNIIEIHDADHMAMLSKPQEVYDSLLEIAHRYARSLYSLP